MNGLIGLLFTMGCGLSMYLCVVIHALIVQKIRLFIMSRKHPSIYEQSKDCPWTVIESYLIGGIIMVVEVLIVGFILQ